MVLNEIFLSVAHNCYPPHKFVIEGDQLLMDGEYLCPYTVDARYEELALTSYYGIDAETEACAEQWEVIERLTGFVKETKWAEDNC